MEIEVLKIVNECTPEILELLKEHLHTPSMIIEWIMRDHPEKITFLEQAKQRIAPKNPHISFLKRLRRLLTSKFDLLRSPSLPNYIKAKYRHPIGTELKLKYSENASYGAKKTALLRKKNGTYVDNRSIELRKSSSPMSLLYYTSRGISAEEAKLKINKQAVAGAHAALKKQQKNKCEQFVANILDELQISYGSPFKFQTYLFDFILPIKNIVIEVNGTYWHCDPRFFNENDQVKFPGQVLLAKQVWDKDCVKKTKLENNGYRVHYVWEHDIIHRPSFVKDRIIYELGRN